MERLPVAMEKFIAVHAAQTRRTVFSGWDVFRSQMPLQNDYQPCAVVNDMIGSLTDLAGETGKQYFERWELLNAYSGCMIGNPGSIGAGRCLCKRHKRAMMWQKPIPMPVIPASVLAMAIRAGPTPASRTDRSP